MPRALASLLLIASLAGCAAAPQARTPLAVHDDNPGLKVCYQLLVCPLVGAAELAR